MDMYELGEEFKEYDLSPEDIYFEIFPDSFQVCEEFVKGMVVK